MIKTYYSDIIADAQVETWFNNRQTVALHGGMGTGKSQFIFDKVFTYALESNVEQIVILSNRARLKEQLKERFRLAISDNEYLYYSADRRYFVIICTYQAFSKLHQLEQVKDGIELNWLDFSKTIVICDEYHYFLADSWNGTTKNCLDIIMEFNCNTYLLSATGEETMHYINKVYNKQIETVSLDTDYRHITLHSYRENKARCTDAAQHIIENVLDSDARQKAVYYCNDIRLLQELKDRLSRKYGDNVAIVCKSGNNQATDSNYKLLHRVTLTTSTLDNGIDFIDDDLTAIVIDSDDLFSIIQSIGRKRTTTKTNVYICEKSVQQLNGYKSALNNPRSKLTRTERYYNRLKLKWLNEYLTQGITQTVYNRLKKTGIKSAYQTDLKAFKDYLRNNKNNIEFDKLQMHLKKFGFEITERTYDRTINSHLNSLKIHSQIISQNNKKCLFLSEKKS